MRPNPLRMTTPPVTKRLHIGPGRRIVAISDIHGKLDYLKGLLEKCDLRPDDVIVLVGDLLEKGPDPLGTLRYVMELSKQREVHAVCGRTPSTSNTWWGATGAGGTVSSHKCSRSRAWR